MVSLRFREFLSGYVAEEFDSLVAQLRALFSVSFNEDGTIQTLNTGIQMPIGAMIDWPAISMPTSGTWLVCNGDEVSRVTYKPLFEVIGTTFGAGDGSTTFNLPDCQDRFSMGKSGSFSLGGVGGAAGHTHTISTGGAHGHTVDSHAHDIDGDGAHDHGGVTAKENQAGVSTDTDGDMLGPLAAPGRFGVIGGHDHNITAESDHDHGGVTGDSSPGTDSQGDHDHGGATGSAIALPPYIVLNKIILAGA